VSRFDGITISRSHYNSTTMWRHPTSQFGIRITTMSSQPHLYVVSPFALKGHRKRASLQGVLNSKVFFPIPCDAILNFISKVRM